MSGNILKESKLLLKVIIGINSKFWKQRFEVLVSESKLLFSDVQFNQVHVWPHLFVGVHLHIQQQ